MLVRTAATADSIGAAAVARHFSFAASPVDDATNELPVIGLGALCEHASRDAECASLAMHPGRRTNAI